MKAKSRSEEWRLFAQAVQKHVDAYTIAQYGEKGNDYLSDKDAAFCLAQIGKYHARFGKPFRARDKSLDMMKIAHYACVAWWKILEDEERTDNVVEE